MSLRSLTGRHAPAHRSEPMRPARGPAARPGTRTDPVPLASAAPWQRSVPPGSPAPRCPGVFYVFWPLRCPGPHPQPPSTSTDLISPVRIPVRFYLFEESHSKINVKLTTITCSCAGGFGGLTLSSDYASSPRFKHQAHISAPPHF